MCGLNAAYRATHINKTHLFTSLFGLTIQAEKVSTKDI